MRAVRLTPEQMTAITVKVNGRASLNSMRDNPQEKKKRDKKYNNVVVDTPDGRFDSRAELRRFEYLSMLLKAKEIKNLRRQVRYELIPAQVTPSGKKERPTHYLADFVYETKEGRTNVEDVKGAVTPEYRLKRKLLLHVHGIEVMEIKS